MASKSTPSVIHGFKSKILKLQITDVNDINLVIDQLNALHDHNFCSENEDYELLLCHLPKLIPPSNEHLLSKFCCLLYFSVHKQKIMLQKTSVEHLVQFLVSVIPSTVDYVQCDALMALSGIMEENVNQVNDFDIILGKNGILINFLSTSYPKQNVQYNAFQCLFSLLGNTKENSMPAEMLDVCYQKCVLVLKEKLHHTTEILMLKTMITSLKCLQHIFGSKCLNLKNHGEVLGVLKSFLFYGLPGQMVTFDVNLYPTLQCPDSVCHLESQSESDSPFPKHRKQKKNKRRLKKPSQRKQSDIRTGDDMLDHSMDEIQNGMTNTSVSSTYNAFPETKMRSSSSDSELSDVDNQLSKIKSSQASLRQHAYLALQAIVKVLDKKIMFGYWSSFLPEHPLIPGLAPNQNLFTTILKDPSSQVRLCALNVLAELLSGSKQFLAHAEERNVKHMSFTSLSSILGSMISEIHRNLLLALLAENSSQLLIQILKCYAALAESVPYSKLNKDILIKLLKHMKAFLYHKDVQVQVACLAVLDAIVSSSQIPPDIGDLLLSEELEHALAKLNTANGSCGVKQSPTDCEDSSWIIELCKRNVFKEEPLPIKVQSLLLLSTVTGKFFHRILPFFQTIDEVVLFCISNSDTTLQLHGAKLLDIIGRSMNISTDEVKKSELKSKMGVLWRNVLEEPLINSITNNEIKTLQNVCCDCLSTLPAEEFEKLPHKKQILFVTILLGLADDSNPNVRGAAIRCLGLFCLFPSLNQDASFLDDVSVILVKSVDDTNANVRFKASWSVGNLSDAFALNRHKLLLNKEISPQFFHSLGTACIRFAADSDRIRANAVRALGNLLNYIPAEFMNSPSMQDLIRRAADTLTAALSSSFSKVCWNSCYALKNMLKNNYLIENCSLDLEKLFHCLFKVLKSPNFKVRISGAQAVTALPSRFYYGKLFTVVWQHLLLSLTSASVDVDFKEIKHQENLCDQLCLSLCQLAVLITPEDIIAMSERLFETRETLLTSMWKFGARMSEDKSAIVCAALDRLTSLRNENEDSDASFALTALHDIFNQAFMAFYNQDVSLLTNC